MPNWIKSDGTVSVDFSLDAAGGSPVKLRADSGLSVEDSVGNPEPVNARNTGRDVVRLSLPAAPNATETYRGWAAYGCVLEKVAVYNAITNTNGSYNLTVLNETTGQTVLNTPVFDMNTLVADTVTPLALSPNDPDLTFSENGRWSVELVSNDPAMNATEVYLSLAFRIS
jgi:hypothetical protein